MQVFTILFYQGQQFIYGAHLLIFGWLEYALRTAFSNQLQLLSVDFAGPFAAVLLSALYAVLAYSCAKLFFSLLWGGLDNLLVHAHGFLIKPTYLFIVSYPMWLLITIASLLIYTGLCVFCSIIILDQFFIDLFSLQSQAVQSTPILQQFYWLNKELAEHEHFRQNFLIRGVLNQQVTDYLINQAYAHNCELSVDSRHQFEKLSQIRASIVSALIEKETGGPCAIPDYFEADQYYRSLQEKKKKTGFFSFFF